MNRHFMKEGNMMANKHKKRSLTSSAIKEIQIKITMICHFTLTTMVIVLRKRNNKVLHSCREIRTLNTGSWNVNWYNHYGK